MNAISASLPVQFGVAAIEFNDETTLIGGTLRNNATGLSEVFLIKLNYLGEKIWEKKYQDNNSGFFCYKIIKDSNTLVVLGFKYNYQLNDGNWSLMKLDTSGTILWSHDYGSDIRGESMLGIVKTSDGGFMTCGFISKLTSEGNNEYVAKLNSLGGLEWTKEYESELNTVSMSLVSDGQGNYVISADKEVLNSSYNVRVKKINGDGEIIWERDVVSDTNSGCKNMVRTSGGDYLIVGESTRTNDYLFDVYLIRIADDGTILKNQTNGNYGVSEAGFSIYEATSNSYVIAGYSDSPSHYKKSALIMIIDSSLNKIGHQLYGDSAINFFNEVYPSSSGGFLAVGNIMGTVDQFLLVHDNYEKILAVDKNDHFQKKLRLYPNPLPATTKTFSIDYPNKQPLGITITSITGQELIQLDPDPVSHTYTIPVNFPSGVYQVSFLSENKLTHLKLVIY